MKLKELMMRRNEVWQRYRVPHSTARVKRNAIFIRPIETYWHAKTKFDVCFYLLTGKVAKDIECFMSLIYPIEKLPAQFITEAEETRTGRVRDIVVLDTAQKLELESTQQGVEKHQGERDVTVLFKEMRW